MSTAGGVNYAGCAGKRVHASLRQTPGLSGEARCRGRMGPRVKAEGDNVRGGTLPCDHSCRLVAERSPLPHQPALAQHDFLEGALVVGGLGGEFHEGEIGKASGRERGVAYVYI